ncbi:hypothetical protein CALVIDRAFT_198003 [Calocera viscosa TUFC12733]|uniref:Uncharacterized protein n=1 Tax=Calocera viscosa (strain TUFC12733) TaxID=1330018 RepID=A0A167KJ41_CALVF|nr:hypothetical protein CALVIDRAFT_198003 [Calocera viscosa TUFC12733]
MTVSIRLDNSLLSRNYVIPNLHILRGSQGCSALSSLASSHTLSITGHSRGCRRPYGLSRPAVRAERHAPRAPVLCLNWPPYARDITYEGDQHKLMQLSPSRTSGTAPSSAAGSAIPCL